MRRFHLFLPALALAVSACAEGLGNSMLAWPAPRPTPSPAELVEQLRLELIPAVDSPTGYGPSFDRAGYAELLDWNQSIRPMEAWADDYEALDVTLPCCKAAHANRDETRNCGCGHHAALFGASKGLLQRGYSLAQTQAELDRWKAFFFPKERLTAELKRRALTDPAFEQAIQSLQEQGLC